MVNVGSRIQLESQKVGVEPRTGVVTAVHGAQVEVRWDDGHETSLVPAAGAMRVIERKRRPSSS